MIFIGVYLIINATLSNNIGHLMRPPLPPPAARPLGARLEGVPAVMEAGREYRVGCATWGSTPTPNVTWALAPHGAHAAPMHLNGQVREGLSSYSHFF